MVRGGVDRDELAQHHWIVGIFFFVSSFAFAFAFAFD